MSVEKINAREASEKLNKQVAEKMIDGFDAVAKAMSWNEYVEYNKQFDELQTLALNEEISNEEYKEKMTLLESPPSSVSFRSLSEFAEWFKETKTPRPERHKSLDDYNGFLNRANARGLSGKYQMIFFRDENDASRMQPRVIIAFPESLSAKERAKVYKEINES